MSQCWDRKKFDRNLNYFRQYGVSIFKFLYGSGKWTNVSLLQTGWHQFGAITTPDNPSWLTIWMPWDKPYIVLSKSVQHVRSQLSLPAITTSGVARMAWKRGAVNVGYRGVRPSRSHNFIMVRGWTANQFSWGCHACIGQFQWTN